MKNYGRNSVSEFLGDWIVYRNLVPVDSSLPSLADLGPDAGLAPGVVPRKIEPVHSQVMVELLKQTRAIDAPGIAIERLLYLGDTHSSDGMCFRNLCQAGGWPGLAFIGAEKDEPAKIEIQEGDAALYLSNRWAALRDFDQYCAENGFPLDEHAAVIVDIDKTALGARGRNDQVINRARVEAVRRTVEEVLGTDFDEGEFRAVYDELNQSQYHPFTADNQDYLAYICLMVSGGVYDFTQLLADLDAERLSTFAQFIAICVNRAIGDELVPVHQEVYVNFQRGDPTPFKSFRYREYEETVRRMDRLPDEAGEERILAEEIVTTREVVDVCRFLRENGVLLFGLTDKPDESSIPRPELAQGGYLPLHRVTMKVIGTPIQ